jgi:hypothetical protein
METEPLDFWRRRISAWERKTLGKGEGRRSKVDRTGCRKLLGTKMRPEEEEEDFELVLEVGDRYCLDCNRRMNHYEHSSSIPTCYWQCLACPMSEYEKRKIITQRTFVGLNRATQQIVLSIYLDRYEHPTCWFYFIRRIHSKCKKIEEEPPILSIANIGGTDRRS